VPQSDLEERYGPALEAGRKLFARAWVFVLGVPSMKFLPPEGPLEVAFAGRSNVGKSSLINAILGQKNIARTSNTPGRTQELNYFIPEAQSETDEGEVAPIALVDMPGYGFAKAPKAQVEAWTKLIFSYLRGRTTLRRVFVLIDSRHGVKANDEEILAMLDEAAVSYQIVLTKADKPKKNELEKVIAQTEQAVSKRPAAFPGIILTSSEKGDGISEVRAAITEAIAG
jgi:GTP-binding protein